MLLTLKEGWRKARSSRPGESLDPSPLGSVEIWESVDVHRIVAEMGVS